MQTASAAVLTVGLTDEADYSSIQSAIDNACPRDTIEIQNGTYYENIILNNSLILKGIEKPLISGNGNDSIITIIADDCIIENIKFSDSGTNSNGTEIDSAILVKSSNNAIINNSFFENKIGIYLLESDLNNLEKNVISDCENGIYLLNSSNNTIYGNDVQNCIESGIALNNSSHNTVERNRALSNSYGYQIIGGFENLILANVAGYNSQHGFSMRPFLGLLKYKESLFDEGFIRPENNVLQDNIVYENCNGFYMTGILFTLFRNNSVYNNINGFYSGADEHYDSPDTWTTVYPAWNTFQDNEVLNNNIGFYMNFGHHNKFIGNNVSFNSKGFRVSSQKDIFEQNEVTKNVEEGFLLESKSKSTLRSNQIKSNHVGIDINGGSNIIYANTISNSDYGVKSCYPNNILMKNVLFDNDYGFSIRNGSYNVISANNLINNNYGIYCISSGNSIYEKNNLQNLVFNAYEKNGLDVWINNYYSDYSGIDSDGDDWYYIPPYNVNKDEFPVIQPWNNKTTFEGASFTLKYGQEVELFDGYVFTFNNIDLTSSRAWFELSKNESFEDRIVSVGDFFQFRLDTFNGNIIKEDERLICLGRVKSGYCNHTDYNNSYAEFDLFFQFSEDTGRALIASNSDLPNQIIPIPNENNNPSTPSAGSSGGGSGGGGATTGEKYENIAFKDVKSAFVQKDVVTTYNFENDENPIEHINFIASRNWGQISSTIEVLHKKSSSVKEEPAGIVYCNVNIWVGKSAFSNPENIDNASVGFKVNKKWIEENSINESTIRLCRYSDGKWNNLQTTKVNEDEANVYFEAITLGFSPFSIVGDAKGTDFQEENVESLLASVTDSNKEEVHASVEDKNMISKRIIVGVLFVTLAGIFLAYRKKD